MKFCPSKGIHIPPTLGPATTVGIKTKLFRFCEAAAERKRGRVLGSRNLGTVMDVCGLDCCAAHRTANALINPDV